MTAFEVDLVASTIPADAQEPHLVRACGAVPTVFEIVYHPWPTPLAASIGDRVLVSGFDLLLHQAAVQFELFTGAARPARRHARGRRAGAGSPERVSEHRGRGPRRASCAERSGSSCRA